MTEALELISRLVYGGRCQSVRGDPFGFFLEIIISLGSAIYTTQYQAPITFKTAHYSIETRSLISSPSWSSDVGCEEKTNHVNEEGEAEGYETETMT